MTPEQTVALKDLKRRGEARAAKQQALELAEAGLYAAVVAADELDVPRVTIAATAGVSRQTVYAVIDRHKRAR